MAQPSAITALTEELAALRARVDELTSRAPLNEHVSRRHLLRGLAGLGVAGAAGVVAAEPAAADDGDPLVLGADNTSTAMTTLSHTRTAAEDFAAVKITSDTSTGLLVQSSRTEETQNGQTAIYAAASANIGSFAVLADGNEGIAIHAFSDSELPTLIAANHGSGAALAGVSLTGGPQLLLEPGDDQPSGPPTAPDPHSAGEILFDTAGDLWMCTADGHPGNWTRLLREDTTIGRVIPITPFRALDTRHTGGRAPGAPAVPGQRKGPLKGGENVTLDLAGIAPIPPTASGVVGNATVIAPTGTGFLRILPAGASVPASSFNFTSGTTIANGFTSALTAAGLRATAPITAGITYHLVIDIAAYIT